jgi:hypothetical protein
MFYPQSNFYPQGTFGHPQGIFGYPQQGGYPQANFGHPGSLTAANGIPFANTLYGYPQQAMLQLLAPQWTAQPFASQPPAPGTNALNGFGFTNGIGLANGTGQPGAGWQQPQTIPEQFNPAALQQSPQHLLQRLAQYHYLVAQQLAHLASQQAALNPGNPYSGQFIPGQWGANIASGLTMH